MVKNLIWCQECDALVHFVKMNQAMKCGGFASFATFGLEYNISIYTQNLCLPS